MNSLDNNFIHARPHKTIVLYIFNCVENMKTAGKVIVDKKLYALYLVNRQAGTAPARRVH